jgi:DNA replication protein DnaC
MLCDGLFIDKAENVLISGAAGCGKSFLACSLGRQACLLGKRTLYYGMSRFMETLASARLDGSLLKWMNQIAKAQLLIIDDFGLKKMDTNARITLLDILEDRYGNGATIITSQLPVSQWHEYIGDNTLADAIMDRVTAHAHRIELQGKSLRKKK